jgi:hypothetical protein
MHTTFSSKTSTMNARSASQLLTTKTCSFAPTNTTLVLGSTQQIRSQLMLNLLITTQKTKLLNLQQTNFETTPTTTTTTPNNTPTTAASQVPTQKIA